MSDLAAEVLFANQVGIRSDEVTGRTWGARGTTPIVRRTENRFSVNAMSEIGARCRMYFMVFTASQARTVFERWAECRSRIRWIFRSK